MYIHVRVSSCPRVLDLHVLRLLMVGVDVSRRVRVQHLACRALKNERTPHRSLNSRSYFAPRERVSVKLHQICTVNVWAEVIG